MFQFNYVSNCYDEVLLYYVFLMMLQQAFVREQITASKTTLYDMEVDCTQKHVLTACQDRNIRVYSVNTSKHTKTFKGSVGEDGSLIKVTFAFLLQLLNLDIRIHDYFFGSVKSGLKLSVSIQSRIPDKLTSKARPQIPDLVRH